MPRYKVNGRYSAMYNAVRLEYLPPAEVDLPAAQAEWVNRDCPGTLTLVEPAQEVAPQPVPEPEVEQEPDDETEADKADDDTAEGGPVKPRRNRQHTSSRTRS